MKISENTSVSMPVRNLISIIGAVAIGVWAYFGVTEKLNNHSTKLLMIEKDLESVVEFSIKYPRGEMGMSANDQEQNILIEFQQGIIEKAFSIVNKSGNQRHNKFPGTVTQFELNGEDITGVICGEGFLGINQLKLEGSSSQDITEFVRGKPGFLGANLG